MPIYYRGAGPGSYWDTHDATRVGFRAQAPHLAASMDRLMNHIAQTTVISPFISLTRSYAIAHGYAIVGTSGIATQTQPGYVYEIELTYPLPLGLVLLDPIKELAAALPGPLDRVSYQHDGGASALLGVVLPQQFSHLLTTPYLQAGGLSGAPVRVTQELVTMVRALRDAEILAVGTIPVTCVIARTPVY
jgi:hypothetical protein